MYLGWLVSTLSLLALIPWMAVIALYSKMADYEERQLEQKLGSRYAEYRKKCPNGYPSLSEANQLSRLLKILDPLYPHGIYPLLSSRNSVE